FDRVETDRAEDFETELQASVAHRHETTHRHAYLVAHLQRGGIGSLLGTEVRTNHPREHPTIEVMFGVGEQPDAGLAVARETWFVTSGNEDRSASAPTELLVIAFVGHRAQRKTQIVNCGTFG